jgi:hypothetical protein
MTHADKVVNIDIVEQQERKKENISQQLKKHPQRERKEKNAIG